MCQFAASARAGEGISYVYSATKCSTGGVIQRKLRNGCEDLDITGVLNNRQRI